MDGNLCCLEEEQRCFDYVKFFVIITENAINYLIFVIKFNKDNKTEQ